MRIRCSMRWCSINRRLWLLYYMACRRNVDLENYKYMHVVPFAADDTYF